MSEPIVDLNSIMCSAFDAILKSLGKTHPPAELYRLIILNMQTDKEGNAIYAITAQEDEMIR